MVVPASVLAAAVLMLAIGAGYAPDVRTGMRAVGLGDTRLAAVDVTANVRCTLARRRGADAARCRPCLETCKCIDRANPKDECDQKDVPMGCGSGCSQDLQRQCVTCVADLR
jgi:hypothetical protein